MGLFDHLRSLLEDPPPGYAFEVSQSGIAWAARSSRRSQGPEIGFEPFAAEVLSVSPVKDNVLLPEDLARHVAGLIPQNGSKRRRDAALILPDYCSRVTLLDFDSFPNDRAEQLALVRFRLKKAVPFDVETAVVSFQATRHGAKHEVITVAAEEAIVAKYEAPFRAAGYQPGFATTSMLATLNLLPAAGCRIVAKLSGRVLSVAVCEGRLPKLVRCVDLDALNIDEVLAVLFPTCAYAQDELSEKPRQILLCGFGAATGGIQQQCQADLGLPAEPLRGAWGPPDETNAGLLGWLQAQEGGAA